MVEFLMKSDMTNVAGHMNVTKSDKWQACKKTLQKKSHITSIHVACFFVDSVEA